MPFHIAGWSHAEGHKKRLGSRGWEVMKLSSIERAEDDVPDGVIQMLARKTGSSNLPAPSENDRLRERCDLRLALDAENVPTHALLLLYLMPVANQLDVDPTTVHAVEVLSDVQECLSASAHAEPFDKDTLALIYSTLAAIRFGVP